MQVETCAAPGDDCHSQLLQCLLSTQYSAYSPTVKELTKSASPIEHNNRMSFPLNPCLEVVAPNDMIDQPLQNQIRFFLFESYDTRDKLRVHPYRPFTGDGVHTNDRMDRRYWIPSYEPADATDMID